MSRGVQGSAQRREEGVGSSLTLQFEIPKLKKMIKVNMNTKSTIKQHLPLFSAKFDSDFTAFHVTARFRLGRDRHNAPIDVPLRHLIANLPAHPEQLIVIELLIAYEGG